MKAMLQAKKEIYENLREEVNVLKASGSISKLINLRNEFDESFDAFFDDKDLRKKYDAWDEDENCINFEISNTMLEEMLDNEDIINLIAFYDNLIYELEEEKKEKIEQKENEVV